jgi:predicted TIM-barrel fold metal-dependent hydrolase
MLNSKIIDCDVHHSYLSQKELYPFLDGIWIDRIKKSGFGYPQDFFRSSAGSKRLDAILGNGVAGSDKDFLIEQLLEKHNISYALLNGGGIIGVSLMAEYEYPMALAKAYNQWLSEEWLKYDERFLGSIHIAIQNPIESAEEIRIMAKNSKVKMVFLPSVLPLPISHPFYRPVLEAINDTGLVLAFHPKQPAVSTPSTTPLGTPSTYLEWHTLAGLSYMTHIVNMVTTGIFDLLPNLKIFFIEGGISWLPSLMWRFDKNYKGLRSQAPWLKKLPSEYILKHCKFCTQPIEEPTKPEYLSQIYEMIDGKNTIIFSTDYPHWDFDSPNTAMQNIPEDWHENILYKNAASFLNL